ncbi:hypothetical protein LSAT2_009649 [Lamellibrachia satsuma]|nr:hypothetical protein LSAT2_009649 [Lamellibrachia satsuma]
MQDMFAWSKEHTHLVLLSQRDSLTSAHYDYDENIFQQIFGYKRFIFFHPDHYGHMYLIHTLKKKTQANFDHPDFERFPKLRKLEGIEAVLGPGDLLYMPSLWWHMVETSSDGTTVHNRPQPSTTIHNHPYSSTIVHNQPQPSTIMYNHPLSSTTVHNHPIPSTLVHNCPQPSTTVHNRPQPSTLVHSRPQPSTTIQYHPHSSTTVHNHPQPSTAVHTRLLTRQDSHKV